MVLKLLEELDDPKVKIANLMEKIAIDSEKSRWGMGSKHNQHESTE